MAALWHAARRSSFALVLLGLLACEVVPPGNAYDPDTPAERQADGAIVGRVRADDVDLGSTRLILLVQDASGEYLEDDGAPLEVTTRIAGEAKPEGLEGEPAGSFEIVLKPGRYTLVYDPVKNRTPRYRPLEVRGVDVVAGGITRADVAPEVIPEVDLDTAIEGVVEGVREGSPVTLTLRAEGAVGVAERSIVVEESGAFRFEGAPPAAGYRIRARGDGYAPAATAAFELLAEHTAESPLSLAEPLRLLPLGEMFSVLFPEGSESPYLPTASVELRAEPLVLAGDLRVEARAGLSPDGAALPDGFDEAWLPLGPGGATLTVDLDESAPDGSRSILAQLRVCLDEECAATITSGLSRLEVVVDRAAPTPVSARVGGSSEGALVVGCVRFSAACPPEAEVEPYVATVEVDALDDSGRVAAWAITLDDEAPDTFTPVTAAGSLAALRGSAPALPPLDGAHVLRAFARDAAGNVGVLLEREVVVDVTPVAFGDPALVLGGTRQFDVDGSEAEILPGQLVTVDVNLPAPESLARWQVRRADGGSLLGQAAAEPVPYGGPATFFVDGLHRDLVQLEAVLLDDAGNASVTPLREVRLWRTGAVQAQLSLEGGAPLSAPRATLLSSSGAPISGTVSLAGEVSFGEVLQGVYTLRLEHEGYDGLDVPGLSVVPAEVSDAGSRTLGLPRGALVGRFVLAGRGPLENSGVQVQLLDADGRNVAGSATLADGSYRFTDALAGTGYRVVGSFEGFASAEVSGVEVIAGAESAINDDGTGLPLPVELRAFEGDFRLCAPTGVLDLDCPALLATNLDTVEVGGIDLGAVSEYRIALAPFATPDDGWQPLARDGNGDIVPPSITFPAGDERLQEVWLQLRQGSDAGDPISASIVFDQTPPSDVALALARGEGALVDGYTRSTTVRATVTANRGAGETAELASARVVFSQTPPLSLPVQTSCSHAVACAIPLDGTAAGAHTAWAFSCDRAGNCTTEPVSASIIYDDTPPDLGPSRGVAFAPVLDDPVQDDGTRAHLPLRDHTVAIESGTAAQPGPDAQPAPEVAAVRLALATHDITAAPLIALEPAAASSTFLAAPSFTGAAGGSYTVELLFVDPAGNTSPAAVSYDVVYDPRPPLLSLSLPALTSACHGEVSATLSDGDGQDLVRVRLLAEDGELDVYDLPTPASSVVRAISLAPALDCGTTPYTLDPARPDGLYVVTAEASDRAGNLALVSRSVLVDRAPPALLSARCPSCVEDGGVLYSSSTSLALEVVASDATSGYAGASVSVNGGTESGMQPPGLALPVTLDAAAVSQTVTVFVHDNAGNRSAGATLSLVLDDGAPQVGSLTIDDGAAFTRARDVVLAVAASDDESALVGMRVANGACTFAGPVAAFQSPLTWTLADGADGPRTVCVEVYDRAGNRAEASATVELDRAHLGGSLTVAGGAARVSTTTVTVAPSALEPSVFAAGTGALDCSSASYSSSYETTPAPVSLALPDEHGLHTVFACLRDEAGNTRLVSDEVALDLEGPGGSMTLAANGGFSTSSTVSVAFSSYAADVAGYLLTAGALASCPAANDAAWTTPFAAAPTLELGGAGAFTVRACLQDDLGNASLLSPQEVFVDLGDPVVSVAVNDGAAYARSADVVLDLSASDDGAGLASLRVANDACTFSAEPSAFVPSLPWQLSAGPDGSRLVCVEVADAAGRTRTATATIVLDASAPGAGALALAGGASPVNAATVSLALSGGDDELAVTLSGDLASGAGTYWYGADRDGAGGVAVLPSSVTLKSANGANVVTAFFTDPAGNTSPAFSALVVVDTIAPADGALALAGGQASVNTQTVAASISGTAADEMKLWEVSPGAPCAPTACDATFTPFASTSTVTLSAGVGDKRVCAQLCDAAGNSSSPVFDDITLSTYEDRPRPILEGIDPTAYVALSAASYPLTISGRGLAHDTQVEVGDFLLDCSVTSSPDGGDCKADPDGGCALDDACAATCATTCVVDLPDEVMGSSGSYVVRLLTPDPVFGGNNTSAETARFTVVAPTPVVTRVWPRGVEQRFDESGGAIAEDISVRVWGEQWMDNVLFRLGTSYGTVLAPGVGTDPLTGELTAVVRFNTAGAYDGLNAGAQRPTITQLAAVNTGTGGGEDAAPFGLVPTVTSWSGSTASPVRSSVILGSAISRARDGNAHRFAAVRGGLSHALAVVGMADVVTVADDVGAVVAFPRATLGGVVPLPLDGSALELVDRTGGSPAVALVDPAGGLGRGTGVGAAVDNLSSGGDPRAAVAADVSGDGLPDMLVALFEEGELGVFLQQSIGDFDAVVATTPAVPQAAVLAPGDFNQDGALDVAVSNSSGQGAVLFGAGDGTFPTSAPFHVGRSITDLGAADVNEDGRPDIVTARAFLLGNGDGTFAAPVGVNNGFEPSPYVDVDGDGHLDHVRLSGSTPRVYLGHGDGDFTGPVATLDAAACNMFTLAVADLNADGAADIAGGCESTDSVRVWLGVGDGSFGSGRDYGVSNGTTYVAIGDVDGDGVPDIVTKAPSVNALDVLHGLGDGAFVAAGTFSALPGFGLSLADVDVDGTLDAFAISGDGVALSRGVAGSLFSGLAQSGSDGSQNRQGPSLVDLDRDGAVDVVVSGEGELLVFEGGGDGTFGFPSHVSSAGASGYTAASDVDGDGRADLAVEDSANVTLFLGDGAGGLVENAVYAMGADASPGIDEVALGDLNGDGMPDLVSVQRFGRDLSVRLGAGDGTFGTKVDIDEGSPLRTLDLADVDNDGDLDAVTHRRVFFNDGAGGLSAGAVLSTADGSVAADVDGDGDLDLVSQMFTGFGIGVTLHRNDGGGTFATFWQNLTMGASGIADVEVADLDGDGAVDLLAADAENDLVTVRLGLGAGAFGPPIDFTMGDGPFDVRYGDLDADGHLDIVSNDIVTDGVSARLLGAAGTWTMTFEDDESLTSTTIASSAVGDASARTLRQTVQRVGVRALLRFDSAPVGAVTLTLVAPDGARVELGSTSTFTPWPSAASPREWRYSARFGEGETAGDLATLYGAQPRGTWTLEVDNATDLEATLVSFQVTTVGSFRATAVGSTATTPEPLRLPSGATGAVVESSTIGASDDATLSCATTSGQPDRFFELELPAANTVSLSVDAAFDPAVELRTGSCASGGAVVSCDEDGWHGVKARIGAQSLAAGTYCVVVDGEDVGVGLTSHGDFDLFVKLGAAVP